MSDLVKAWIEQAGTFLAQAIDNLFINDFLFKVEDAPEYMKHFCFKGNILYITCFDEPKPVLWFCIDPNGIKIESISRMKAIVWGQIIKNEALK